MGRGISAKLRGMNSIWGRLESLGGTFLGGIALGTVVPSAGRFGGRSEWTLPAGH
jgi:hypothetical protein